MPSSPSKLNSSGCSNNRFVPDTWIRFVGRRQAGKGGQLNREKSGQSRAGTVFSLLVSNPLCARRARQSRNQTARIQKRPRIRSQKSRIHGSMCSPERLGLLGGVFSMHSMPQQAEGSNNREAPHLSHSLTHPLVSRSRAFYNPGIT